MNYYEALRSTAEPVEVIPGQTSYFSVSADELDPRIMFNSKLRPEIREAILVLLFNHLSLGYNAPEAWATAWLAGSGVAYNWSAARSPADLDCLVGIDYVQFRQSNQEYKGWSDREIASEINQGFKNELHPRTDNFMGTYELTFYVNTQSDITKIKPYAAYSVTNDDWVVPPAHLEAPSDPLWAKAAENDVEMANQIIKRYTTALNGVRTAAGPARINYEAALKNAVEQGAALFDAIHETRGESFSEGGEGYHGFSNYRWQAGKQSGAIQALKKLKDVSRNAQQIFTTETYGVELPDVSTLIRRATRS